MKRPAKFRVGQILVDSISQVPFRVVKKEYADGEWFYWDFRGNGWHYQYELRPLNKKEREG
ncbi:hypothetical protein LCGC14_2454650 [marine sediment metagenome]|uniref:Uncharacterized protein n=1 Tax=marine sediment metagenome TaxID=412755 RepID=A0A0F9DS76_9ZZZZ